MVCFLNHPAARRQSTTHGFIPVSAHCCLARHSLLTLHYLTRLFSRVGRFRHARCLPAPRRVPQPIITGLMVPWIARHQSINISLFMLSVPADLVLQVQFPAAKTLVRWLRPSPCAPSLGGLRQTDSVCAHNCEGAPCPCHIESEGASFTWFTVGSKMGPVMIFNISHARARPMVCI